MVINKNPTQSSGLLFWTGCGRRGGPRGVTHFYGSSLARTFEFSRISKTNLSSVEYLKIHFLNHLACFFWNRPLIDRSVLGAEIYTLPTSLTQNFYLNFPKIKFVTYYNQNIRLSPVSQQFPRLQSERLYFNEIRVTYAIFAILKEAD